MSDVQAFVSQLTDDGNKFRVTLESARLHPHVNKDMLGIAEAAFGIAVLTALESFGKDVQMHEQNARKAQVMHDMFDALGVKWGEDPYARIEALKMLPVAVDVFSVKLLERGVLITPELAEATNAARGVV